VILTQDLADFRRRLAARHEFGKSFLAGCHAVFPYIACIRWANLIKPRFGYALFFGALALAASRAKHYSRRRAVLVTISLCRSSSSATRRGWGPAEPLVIGEDGLSDFFALERARAPPSGSSARRLLSAPHAAHTRRDIHSRLMRWRSRFACATPPCQVGTL
jgi:hypothetical protein